MLFAVGELGNVSVSLMHPPPPQPRLAVTDDFSGVTSPGTQEITMTQPGPPACFPISLVQLFREVLRGAPSLG